MDNDTLAKRAVSIEDAVNAEIGIRRTRTREDPSKSWYERVPATKRALRHQFFRVAAVTMAQTMLMFVKVDEADEDSFTQALIDCFQTSDDNICDFCDTVLTPQENLEEAFPCPEPGCGIVNDVCHACRPAHIDSETGTIRKCSPLFDLSPCNNSHPTA